MQTTTAQDAIAKIRLHLAQLEAERLKPTILRDEDYVIRHVANKLPIVLVDTKQSLVGFRFAPSTIGATRWSKQGAELAAAGINNSYPQYDVEAVSYLDAIDNEIANGHQCMKWLERAWSCPN